LTIAAFAASRVSGRKYHSAVQASTSYGTPHDSAIAPRPMFAASAITTYSRFRRSSGGRFTFPPAWMSWSVNPVRASSSTQHGRERHARQQPGQLGAQRVRLRGDVLGGQRRDDQPPVVGQAHLAVRAAGQVGLQFAERGVQLVVGLRQRLTGGGGFADQVAELDPLRLPLLRG
jgi:hypothetical protein